MIVSTFSSSVRLECLFLLFFFGLQSCQQSIEVELPEAPDLYVLDGKIFSDEPPLVFVGKAQGYFDAVDASSIAQSFLPDAEVVMTIGEEVFPLVPLCTGELTGVLL